MSRMSSVCDIFIAPLLKAGCTFADVAEVGHAKRTSFLAALLNFPFPSVCLLSTVLNLSIAPT